jgi:hypothetical protein
MSRTAACPAHRTSISVCRQSHQNKSKENRRRTSQPHQPPITAEMMLQGIIFVTDKNYLTGTELTSLILAVL